MISMYVFLLSCIFVVLGAEENIQKSVGNLRHGVDQSWLFRSEEIYKDDISGRDLQSTGYDTHASEKYCAMPAVNKSELPPLSVGVFLQVGNFAVWQDMFDCLLNVVELVEVQNSVRLGVHISFAENLGPNGAQRRMIEASVRSIVQDVHVMLVENAGADIGQFLYQIQDAERLEAKYDFLLKIHSKTNPEWRNLGLQSMCGTMLQVKSILQNLIQTPKLHMIAPVGTVFYAGSSIKHVAPIIVRTYAWHGEERVSRGLHASNREGMELLRKLISPELSIHPDMWSIVAGSMFWVRYKALRSETWAKQMSSISPHFTRGYTRDGGMEHAVERFLPTMIESAGGTIATMPPAPKVFAIYFPQYHRIPENDRFWGPGFTEWTLLQPFNVTGIRKPLSVKKGGLGFYNLTEKRVRQCHARWAKAHGVQGFMFYHYWFTDPIIGNRQVMERVPELMLKDGEPSLPFFFSWANEPWTRRWDGVAKRAADKGTLLAQDYGNRSHWIEHAEYLMKFFKHEKYVKIGNRPVFVIYRPGHLEQRLVPMLRQFDEVAQGHGFAGIYYISTVGNFYRKDEMDAGDVMQSAFHFLPTLQVNPTAWHHDPPNAYIRISSNQDLRIVRERRQFWGAYLGFNNVVRNPNAMVTKIENVDASLVQKSLSETFKAMGHRVPNGYDGLDNLVFLAAWNEWNEQCVLEPDDKLGFAYLAALRRSLGSVAAREINQTLLKVSSPSELDVERARDSLSYAIIDGNVTVRRKKYSSRLQLPSFAGTMRISPRLLQGYTPRLTLSEFSLIKPFEYYLWDNTSDTIDVIKQRIATATGLLTSQFALHFTTQTIDKDGKQKWDLKKKLAPWSIALTEYREFVTMCAKEPMCETLHGKYIVDVSATLK